MKSLNLLFATLLTLLSLNLFSEQFILLDKHALEEVKTTFTNGQALEDTNLAYAALIDKADSLLSEPHYSVVDKTILPPSNNLHDYLSISRYWWPDESKDSGLPWIRRDGETNPDTQTDHVDRNRLGDMTQAVSLLSKAYSLSGNDEYAKKASALISTWFLDEETRMNPHLEFAQSVPGNDKRRRSGILDGRLISLYIPDSINFIRGSGFWSDQNNEAMNQWLNDYLIWLTSSELGLSGATQTNNHGSWYFFQTVALAWYLNDKSLLSKQLEQAQKTMQFQFDKEGRQSHELERTKSYFYSCFNLQALTSIAIIADKAEMPFWDAPSKQNSTLAQGISYLLPAAEGRHWPHPTKGVTAADCIDVFHRYAEYSGSVRTKAVVRNILTEISDKEQSSSDKVLYQQYALFYPELLPE